eukprot:4638376-Amphidinium_carterae.1
MHYLKRERPIPQPVKLSTAQGRQVSANLHHSSGLTWLGTASVYNSQDNMVDKRDSPQLQTHMCTFTSGCKHTQRKQAVKPRCPAVAAGHSP